MEELFTKETLEMVFNLLEKVSDGSVTVLVTYFLLPLLMLIVEAGVWLGGVYILAKYTKICIEKYLNQHRTNITKAVIKDRFIHVEDLDKFNNLLESLSDSGYVHGAHLDWFKQAVKNQKKIDKYNDGSYYRPSIYVHKEG